MDKELKEILDALVSYIPNANLSLVEKAYNLAKRAHGDQKRATGKPFIVHPIGVAKLLTELRASSISIVTAFLHDVVEDSKLSLDEIKKEFGVEASSLVEALTKLDKIEFESKEVYNAENLRKIILATSKDVRVMLIKLADRLDNMKTLEAFREEKQKRIATETLHIYAPIAHKIGMWRWAAELEDLSMKYLYPKEYEFLRSKISEKKTEREKKAKEIIKLVKLKLEENNIKAEVYGRVKHFYSIFRKMQKRKVDFNEIYDLIAIRVVTKTVPECYTVLGIVHELFHPIPGRVKDYISVPKANGYQSIHTAVVGKHGKILEFQIRTEKMHQYAEDGIAAHWRYHGTDKDKLFDKKISWLKQFLEWRKNYSDAMDFMEDFRFDLFENEIVVFTPKGDAVSLPEGSSPVDFAYEIHTNIGNSTSQCYVNNQLVQLDHKLKSGDIVRIVTSKNARPSRNWLNFVKTSLAKNKIRQTLGIITEHTEKPRKERRKEEVNAIMNIREKLDMGNVKGAIKLSKCCNPIVGDDIRAFKAKDGRIHIHRTGCDNIPTLDMEREFPVSWKTEEGKGILGFIVNVQDRVGMLGEILNALAKEKIALSRINFKQEGQNSIKITLQIKNLPNVDKYKVYKVVKGIDGVESVEELK